MAANNCGPQIRVSPIHATEMPNELQRAELQALEHYKDFSKGNDIRYRSFEMKLSTTHNLYLPNEIDVKNYDAVSAFAADVVNPNTDNIDQKDKWFVFSSGWNGLAYR